MRAEWRDPDDLTPSVSRTARTVTGWRGYDPLRKCLKRHGAASSISERHIAGADLLRGLADGACIGFSAPHDDVLPVTSIVYRPMAGPSVYARRQERCWRRFVRTMAIFTRAQRELLTLAVLQNTAVSRIAEARNGNPSRLMGELVAVLDQLDQYFSSEIDEALSRGIAA